MAHLTARIIRTTPSDEALFKVLGRELERRLPNGREADDTFVAEIRGLTVGLRSMASTYELSVSLCLDDLGWHFGNNHHKELARETERGLLELGAVRMASLFARSLELSEEYWEELGRPEWYEWYGDSPLEEAVRPLNDEAWALQEEKEILDYWVSYAREHPDRCVDDV